MSILLIAPVTASDARRAPRTRPPRYPVDHSAPPPAATTSAPVFVRTIGRRRRSRGRSARARPSRAGGARHRAGCPRTTRLPLRPPWRSPSRRVEIVPTTLRPASICVTVAVLLVQHPHAAVARPRSASAGARPDLRRRAGRARDRSRPRCRPSRRGRRRAAVPAAQREEHADVDGDRRDRDRGHDEGPPRNLPPHDGHYPSLRPAVSRVQFGCARCVLIAAAAAVLCAALAVRGGSAASSPTYYRDVAPILDAKCASCHRLGGIAPFALTTAADAKAHAGGHRPDDQGRA